MSARCLKVDLRQPEPEAIALAAELLQRGELVAFPTETVYGLGAHALDAAAVRKIFAAKGRPAHNPLIVHVASAEQARRLVAAWPATADRLAAQFWPGALTLVLPKRPEIPAEVTGGGETVAVRVPDHPVALALLKAAGVPVAAPSANRSNRISPTLAEHVMADLAERVTLVLDGGPTARGLESTVLDLTAAEPRILRPGPITVAQLESALETSVWQLGMTERTMSTPLPSPGMLQRHYAPRTPLEMVDIEQLPRFLAGATSESRLGWLHYGPPAFPRQNTHVVLKLLPDDAAGYGTALYAALHELDRAGVQRIIVTRPPTEPAWSAVQDRLRRAAEPRTST